MCHLNTVYHYASLCFLLFEYLAIHFECLAKHSKQRIMQEAPLLALHLPKSHTKAITHVPQIVTYVVREKGMEYKGELW